MRGVTVGVLTQVGHVRHNVLTSIGVGNVSHHLNVPGPAVAAFSSRVVLTVCVSPQGAVFLGRTGTIREVQVVVLTVSDVSRAAALVVVVEANNRGVCTLALVALSVVHVVLTVGFSLTECETVSAGGGRCVGDVTCNVLNTNVDDNAATNTANAVLGIVVGGVPAVRGVTGGKSVTPSKRPQG